jgi:hypothetical protein
LIAGVLWLGLARAAALGWAMLGGGLVLLALSRPGSSS